MNVVDFTCGFACGLLLSFALYVLMFWVMVCLGDGKGEGD